LLIAFEIPLFSREHCHESDCRARAYRGRTTQARRIAAGIPIDDETWREIAEAANGLGVPLARPRAYLRRYAPTTIAAGM
jgi:hypothetical protein